jgi:hypothetical protein
MMASRASAYGATPLDVLLASVPSLPRALLSRLTARMIERMDELDGDPELEDDDPAGADHDLSECDPSRPEPGFIARLPVYNLDQRRGPANNDDVNRAWQEYMIAAPPPPRPRHA